MKKVIFKLIIGCICIIAGVLLSSKEDQPLSELASCNVEALAAGESEPDIHCRGEGDIDCFGRKVKLKMTNLSLNYPD